MTFGAPFDCELVLQTKSAPRTKPRAQKSPCYAIAMNELSQLADAELLERMPALVLAERARSTDVVENQMEIDQRRLYRDQACRSLSCYCIERLGYSEDEAGKRVTAARLASRFPGLLAELRAGALHLTGLCLLGQY